MIKSRRIQWAGLVARTGTKMHVQSFGGQAVRKEHDIDVGGRIILKWILEKYYRAV
jgi:hypothetical protein